MVKQIFTTVFLLALTVSAMAQQAVTDSATNMKYITLSTSVGRCHPLKDKSGIATSILAWSAEVERASWQTPYKGTSIGLKFSSLGYGFDFSSQVENVTEADHLYYVGIPLSYMMRANENAKFIFSIGLRPDYLVAAKAKATDGRISESVDSRQFYNPVNLSLFARATYMATSKASIGAHVEFNAIPVIKAKYADKVEKTNMWNLMLTLGYRL